MKKLLSLVLCMLLLLSLAACEKDNDDGENGKGTAGNDKNQTTSSEPGDQTNEHEGPWVVVELNSNSYVYERYIYDEAGRIVEKQGFNTRVSEVEPTSVYTYTYTELADGNTQVRFASEGEMCYAYEQVYSADGFCLESAKYVANSMENIYTEEYCTGKNTYTYDAQKRLTQIDRYFYNYDRPSLNSHTYLALSYDAEGRLVKIEEYREETYYETGTYTYDENGDVKVYDIQCIDDSWSMNEEYTSEYDYDGQLVSRKALVNSRGADVYRCDYEYDAEKRLSKMRVRPTYSGLMMHESLLCDGYMLDQIYFSQTGEEVVLMPLSLVLEQQNAQ